MNLSNSNSITSSNAKHIILGLIFLTSLALHVLPILSSSSDALNPLKSSKKIVRVITIEGVIDYKLAARHVRKELKKIEQNDAVSGVILEINSPGGSIGGSAAIHRTVMKFKEKTKKPVVTMFGSMGASGAYYAACATDAIFAHPGAITGSIGVYIESWDFSTLLKRWGIKSNFIKSGKFKGILSPSKPASQDELKLLQTMISREHQNFINVVYAARKKHISLKTLKQYADGRPIVAEQAMELGLIDKIGIMDDALEHIQSILKTDEELDLVFDQKPIWNYLM